MLVSTETPLRMAQILELPPGGTDHAQVRSVNFRHAIVQIKILRPPRHVLAPQQFLRCVPQ